MAYHAPASTHITITTPNLNALNCSSCLIAPIVPPPHPFLLLHSTFTRICSPDDTPWEGGTFNLTLQFSEEYPNRPPVVKFVSKLFHPNVYNDGGICLDILQSNWSPIYDISAVLTSIQSLLCDPNPNSPANSEAARLFQENRREYNKRVQQIVEESWTP